MSSTINSGYYARQAANEKDTKCKKSDDGKHQWVRHGQCPSHWDECKHCKEHIYYK